MTVPAAPWRVAREAANLFIGPLTVTATANGVPVDPSDVQFALVPSGQRPADTDWKAPDADPDGDGTVGVLLQPVTAPGYYGWWVKVTVGATVDVIEPSSVAWVVRT